MQHLVCEPWR